MKRADLVPFIRANKYAVQASMHANGAPQAAVVGVAVDDALELVFDTLDSTRKFANLKRDARIALVIHDDTKTLQYEGVADFPSGDELERIIAVYLDAFPDGVERRSWPGIAYIRVKPTWLRFSDFSTEPPTVVDL